MKRRSFLRWARNAAGLLLLEPEELLNPRRFWPGANFVRPEFPDLSSGTFKLWLGSGPSDPGSKLLASVPLRADPANGGDVILRMAKALQVEASGSGYLRGEFVGKDMTLPVNLETNLYGRPTNLYGRSIANGQTFVMTPEITFRIDAM